MEYLVFFVVIFLFLILLFVKGILDAEKEKKKFIRNLYEKYGEQPQKEYPAGKMERICSFYWKHKQDGQIDDITWNDLNMDEVYKRVNYMYTSAGEEYLYYTLRTPVFSEEELKYRENLIQHFSAHPHERVQLQTMIAELGYSGKYSIYDYIDNLNVLGERSNFKHILANVLFVPAIALCVIKPMWGITALATLIIYNFTTYFKEKGEIDPYITSFAYVMRLLKVVEQIVKLKNTCFEREKKNLEKSRKGLSLFKRGSFWLMSSGRMSGSGNPLDILMDYLRMMFHLDIIKFNKMLAQVRLHLSDVDDMLFTVGYLETMIAIGAYRKSLQEWCVPERAEQLSVEEIVHPLLEDAVSNSISVKKSVLLTGSNASGKSTFLKTLAVNAIMAQTLHTCLAKSFQGPLYQVYSSMALRDDIGSGESYYIVEIKSIKRILDKSRENNCKVLCFVDEVLRGTNTVERIAASTQILKCLAGEKVTCFAATHDIELAELLKGLYDNYHFEEEIVEDDVHFSYQLKCGKATTRNAIKLLKVMGYEDKIINQAEDMAGRFMAEGVWRL